MLGRITLGFCLVAAVWALPSYRGAGRPSSSPVYSQGPAAHPTGPGQRSPQSGQHDMPPIDTVISRAMQRGRPGVAPPASDPDLVEMDMRLTLEQRDMLYGKPDPTATSARIAISGDKYRWTDATVPYEIDDVFDTAQKKQILDAMKDWEKLTCLRFVRRSKQRNYIRIISANGCWSEVGMVGGKQEMSIDVRGCLFHHTIMHELGHVAGFHHEQTRPDRDSHLNIMTANIKAGLDYNFEKYKWGYVQDYGLLYDYWSVMHYSQWAFSKNGRPTITTLNKEYQDVIGTTPGASIRDVKTIHLMYKCSANCDENQCPSTAIMSPTCKCWCNSGIPGNPVVEWDGRSECKGPNAATDPCLDFLTDCDQRARSGQCDSDPGYMLRNCRRSCRLCGPNPVCKDYADSCLKWALRGECESNPSYMNRHCRKSCYVCSDRPEVCTTDQSPSLCSTFAGQGDCEDYRDSMLERCSMACKACPTAPGYQCRNWHVECTQWKNFGRCDAEPAWMELHCPKACGKCTGGNIPDCRNYASDADCDGWAKRGECAINPSWMLYNCAKSCKTCGSEKACLDRRTECDDWRDNGYCQTSDDGPLLYFECPVACNHCTPTDPAATGTCKNYSPQCSDWAQKGWCDTKPDLMLWSCPRACQICGPVTVCKNYDEKCTGWAASGECQANPNWMSVACAKACNTCPGTGSADPSTTVTTPTTTTPTTTTTTPTTTTANVNNGCKDAVGRKYCQTLINVHRYDCKTYAYWMVKNCAASCGACGKDKNCKNYDSNCDYWAQVGECTRNPSYMVLYCPAACKSCQPTPTTTTPTTTTMATTTTVIEGVWTTEFDKKWCPDYIRTSKCQTLAGQGKCETNRGHMFSNCAATCQVCGNGANCRNFERDVNSPQCDNWARVGHCTNSPTYMKIYCRRACGVCQ